MFGAVRGISYYDSWIVWRNGRWLHALSRRSPHTTVDWLFLASDYAFNSSIVHVSLPALNLALWRQPLVHRSTYCPEFYYSARAGISLLHCASYNTFLRSSYGSIRIQIFWEITWVNEIKKTPQRRVKKIRLGVKNAYYDRCWWKKVIPRIVFERRAMFRESAVVSEVQY